MLFRSLRRLGLVSGGAAQADVPVALHQVTLGGQDYLPDPSDLTARLDVSGAGAGLGLRLRFAADLRGPCQRCLADAVVHVDVDARDFQTTGRDNVRTAPSEPSGAKCRATSYPRPTPRCTSTRQAPVMTSSSRDA